MFRIPYTLLLILMIAGLTAPAVRPALGQAGESAAIRTLLQQRDSQIKKLLGDEGDVPKDKRDQLVTLVNGIINFRALGGAALGPHWDELSADQQDNYISVFADIVRQQSLADLNIYRARVSYNEIDVVGDSAYVRTMTVYKDVPAPVDYVMGKAGDDWTIHDIIIDEVSTADGYARSFQTVVRKKGFDALMSSLHKKRDKVLGEPAG